jgi:hypothetical protein
MSFWTFVFACFALLMMIPLSAIWTEHVRKSRKLKAEGNQQNSTLLAEVRVLRQRLEVLEAIVTDKGYDLRAQLAALEREASDGADQRPSAARPQRSG